jgi:CDP-diacylglycerol--glycerol-3-phosphate 3-phosphatidyltransferase/cardiolipin synthase
MKLSIATWLTLARIGMIPIVVVLFYMKAGWASPAAAAVFVMAALTDWLDGYVARRLGNTTRLGAFLDPVADKLMVATALILLVSHDSQPLPLLGVKSQLVIAITAAIIVGREITISALREWMAELGARGKVAVSFWGKLKTIFQMTGLSTMLFGRDDIYGLPFYEIGVYCLIAAAILTLYSMAIYLRAAWPDLIRASSS